MNERNEIENRSISFFSVHTIHSWRNIFAGRSEAVNLAIVLLTVLIIFLAVALGKGLSLTAHSNFDSYTLQAMAWREGKVTVDGPGHTWLELAIYHDEYYVSFPPFPSVVMYPLTFIFGENTPTLMINLIMVLCSAGMGYRLLRRRKVPGRTAVPVSVFFLCGCSLFIIMTRGGVWYIAQGI